MASSPAGTHIYQPLLPNPNPIRRLHHPYRPPRRCCRSFLESPPPPPPPRVEVASPLLPSLVTARGPLRSAQTLSQPTFLRSASLSREPLVDNDVAQPPSSNASSKRVLVIGGTGGVGQLVLAGLLDRGYAISAVLRDVNKAKAIFGESNLEKIDVIVSDTRSMAKLDPSVFEGVTHVICCTGTTAFPSKRWDGDNTPENTDWHGVKNLIDALPKSLQRLVLVSSIGVTKYDQLPWSIMNLFGVLKYKKMAEDYLRDSGIPYTIIRPGRLTDGPYTSYDLNTLLKATAGARRSVVIGQGDKLIGEASRIIVAEACIQALDIECTCWNTYEINSIEGGDGPGKDKNLWEDIFNSAHTR